MDFGTGRRTVREGVIAEHSFYSYGGYRDRAALSARVGWDVHHQRVGGAGWPLQVFLRVLARDFQQPELCLIFFARVGVVARQTAMWRALCLSWTARQGAKTPKTFFRRFLKGRRTHGVGGTLGYCDLPSM